MKRVFKPAGQVLMTAALTSIAFDTLALTTIATPESAPSNPSIAPEVDLTESSSPAADSIVNPEAIATQEFSHSQTSAITPETAAASDAEVAPMHAEPELQPVGDDVVMPGSGAPSTGTPITVMPDTITPDTITPDTVTPVVDGGSPEQQVSPEGSEIAPSSYRLDIAVAANPSLSDRLAEILERERPEREARLRENLAASTLYYIQIRDFEQARRTAQNLALPLESQTALLDQIAVAEAQIAAVLPQDGVDDSAAGAAQDSPASAIGSVPSHLQGQISTRYLGQLRSSPRRVCRTEIDQIATPQLRMERQLPDMLYSLVERSQQYRLQRNVGKCATPTINLARYQPTPQNLMFQGQGFNMTYPLAVLAEITSRFGWRIHPITGDRRFHYGIDFGAAYGTPVVAALTGQVVSADFLGGYGMAVVLEHDSEDAPAQRTLYAHLSDIAVQPGTQVEQGQVIGWVGSTGNSTGPHLHFEIQVPTADGWVAIDPTTAHSEAVSQR